VLGARRHAVGCPAAGTPSRPPDQFGGSWRYVPVRAQARGCRLRCFGRHRFARCDVQNHCGGWRRLARRVEWQEAGMIGNASGTGEAPTPGTPGLPDWAPEGIDLDAPSVARAYDYMLGGAHNFAIDREWARSFLTVLPDFRVIARA